MKPVDKTGFNITEIEKRKQIARDIEKYNLSACCLQETKTVDDMIGVKKHKLDPLQSVFVTLYNPLWKWICYNQKMEEEHTVHWCCKVSDKVSVLPFKTN